MRKSIVLILSILIFPSFAYSQSSSLSICSFNIQFLGNSKDRYNHELASILEPFDIVVIQELVAPPTDGNYPDGDGYFEDPEAAEFFDEMAALGFDYSLSKEDTGPGEDNHKANNSTEWSLVFFKDTVEMAADLPNRFIGRDLTAHKVYRRVPHAHSFRTENGNLDFVIVNVHLYPDKKIEGIPGKDRKEERKKELKAISKWVNNNDTVEKDFFIVGDMNINNKAELDLVTPSGWVSLNDELDKTNTAAGTDKPYDHVMYRPQHTTEMDTAFDQRELPLIADMEPLWHGPGTYPGNPYVHNTFRRYFSDHVPISFKLNIPSTDDD
jgi:endonuclease/exonuclease/phosphatase family metal-dependent hydrolase